VTNEERGQFQELIGKVDQHTQLMSVFLKDKADPLNGWKTERALFEQKVVATLDNITEKISCLPEMQKDCEKNTDFRAGFMKVFWIVITPILAGSGVGIYFLVTNLAK